MPRPALTLSVLVTVLFWLALVFLFPLFDSDFFWHLETGRWIVENGWSIPPQDPFSATAHLSGKEFRVYGWAFDVLQYLLHRAGGDLALRGLFATLVILCLWPLYALLRFITGNSRQALMLSSLALLVCGPFLTARPTLVTYFGFNLLLYVLFRHSSAVHSGWFFGLPLLFLVWGNLHPGYLAGLALIALFATCGVLDRLLPIAPASTDRAPPRLGHWFLLALVCLLMLCVNPYGPAALIDILTKFQADASSFVFEWQSPDFRSLPGRLFLIPIVIWVVVLFIAEKRGSWIEVLLPLSLCIMGMNSVRHIPLAAFALVVGIAFRLRVCNQSWIMSRSGQKKPVLEMFERIALMAIRDRGEPSVVLKVILIALTAGLLLLLKPVIDDHHRKSLSDHFPVEGVRFIKESGLSGPVFNTYHLGGFLIHVFKDSMPVFIDGRYNPFEGQVLQDYVAITRLRHDWRDRVAHYGFKLAVLDYPDRGIAAALRQSGEFRLVFSDEKFAVLIHQSVGRPDLPDVNLLNERSF